MTAAEKVLAALRKSGFPLAGIVDIEAARDRYNEHALAYERWIGEGRHGSMDYLRRGLDRRKDPRLVYPEARSVVAVAFPYRSQPLGSVDPATGPRLARYLEGGDYHVSVKDRLESALETASRALVEEGEPPLGFKACVDTSSVLERTWAWLAGLGWIGKNSLLIHPTLGSYLFLGVALLDREFGEAPKPLADYCGHCRRCLDGCPTGAFAEERVLDSRRCISALTLEDRGPRQEDPWIRSRMQTWIAGCDVCQEVCPFNRRRVRLESSDAPIPPVLSAVEDSWAELLDIELSGIYRERSKGSAIERVKPMMFRRNLAVALTNAISLSPDAAGWENLLERIERLSNSAEVSSDRAAWAEAAEKIRSRLQTRSPSSMP